MADVIEIMQTEARELGGRFVAWRELGDSLVNCRARPDGAFEWRHITGRDMGRAITEATARRLLERAP